MRLWHQIDGLQQAQRGALMPWAPVFLGLGVALYFSLWEEPGVALYGVAIAMGLAVAIAGRIWRGSLGPVATALALVALGLCLAGWRAHQVAGPVLEFRYYGAIEGRIVAVDRSASDALRLTLDDVVLERTDPARAPTRVRVSLHGQQDWLVPEPGARVMMTGHLGPPEGPAEPGGFDFQRHAWFLQLGAVGYTRNPALILEHRAPGAAWLMHLRLTLSAAIQERIDGQPGAFAAAVLTGDRSGLAAGPVEDMRASNIAHLLAISGLHMGLLTGFVYAALRFGLALIPALALRHPIRKWAAMGALAAGAFYLALSGGNVATERAFIQVAVMFVAVLLDRRAITLRSVAIAALIVLAHRPETLLSPGFQMSFAATAALVAVFNALRFHPAFTSWPVWTRGVVALVISSAVAGAATAPFSAAHFNQIAVYGLIANLLTVPVMGSLVIPAAVIAGLLWPLGLEALPFWVMEQGLAWILAVAHEIAAFPGATRPVVMPPGAVLGMISLGMLFVILWQGRLRLLGFGPVMAALILWSGAERPEVLVAPSGRLVGLMAEDGRALSKPRGDGFVAGIWLENDGDVAGQEGAAERQAWRSDGEGQSGRLQNGATLWQGVGRRAAAGATEACGRHDLVVISEPAAEMSDMLEGLARQTATHVAQPEAVRWHGAIASAPGAETARLARVSDVSEVSDAAFTCFVISREVLTRTGALAITSDANGFLISSARGQQGARLWTGAE